MNINDQISFQKKMEAQNYTVNFSQKQFEELKSKSNNLIFKEGLMDSDVIRIFDGDKQTMTYDTIEEKLTMDYDNYDNYTNGNLQRFFKKIFQQGGSIPMNENKEFMIDNTIQPDIFGGNTKPKENLSPGLFNPQNIEEFEYGGVIKDVGNWDDIPNSWRNITKVKPLKIVQDPKDKDFQKLMGLFVGDDDLRPAMKGVDFNDTQIAVTDAFKVLVLPNKTDLRGVIVSTRQSKKSEYKIGQVIDAKYPNYKVVIPEQNNLKHHKISLYKLYQFAHSVKNFSNGTTKAISLNTGDKEQIGFDAEKLINVLKSFLIMGYEEIYFHHSEPKRAAVFSPKEYYSVDKLKEPLALLMPIMPSDEGSEYSAVNFGFDFSTKVKFDISKNEIINADGSIAKFKMSYGEDEFIPKELINLAKRIKPTNTVIPILDNIAVKNGILKSSDLESHIEIPISNVKDGLYGFWNNVPYHIVDGELDDYPKIHSDNLKNVITKLETTVDYLNFICTRTEKYVSKDEMRPVMSGVNMNVTRNNITFAATDAHILIRLDAEDNVKLIDGKENSIVFKSKPVKYFCEYLVSGKVGIEIYEYHILFYQGNKKLYSRLIDGKFPNYNVVIPEESDKQITIATSDLREMINSDQFDELKKLYPEGQGRSISAYNAGGELNAFAVEHGKDDRTVLGYLNIDKYPMNFKTNVYTSANNSCAIVMPAMNADLKNEGDALFTFNPDIIKKILYNVKVKEITLNYSQLNRAYLIQDDFVEYVAPKQTKVKETKPKKTIKAIAAVEKLNIAKALIGNNLSSNELIKVLEKIDKDHFADLIGGLELLN